MSKRKTYKDKAKKTSQDREKEYIFFESVE